MSVPGSNILAQALTVITPQTVAYHRFIGKIENPDNLLYVNKYAASDNMRGSFQAVPRSMYQSYGLDFQKKYRTFFATADILDVEREISGDQITYCDKRYQVLSDVSDWYDIDGWTGVLCVLIGGDNAR